MSSPTPASTPVATPDNGGIPVVSDAVRLLRVLISPGAVFAEIQEKPTFWGPFAVIAILNVVLNYLQQPFNQRIGQIMTERAGRPFTEPTAVRTAISAVLGGALGPLVLCLLVGGVLSNRGVAGINGPQDLFVSLGADLLLPTDATVGNFTRLVLAGIGPLPIWKLTITAVGLMVLGKTGKSQGWTAAIIIYICAVLMAAGLGAWGMRMMGG